MCNKYPPPYRFHLSNLEAGQEVLFEGVRYDAQTLFSTDDPCKMVDFIEAVEDQVGDRHIGEYPGYEGIIECLKEQCLGSGSDAGGGPHDPFIEEPSANGVYDGPVTEENPETLGYDLPEIEGAMDSDYSYPEDDRNPAEQYYSQANNLEDYEIEDKARERGESEDDVRETLDRAAKGEPEEGQPHNGRSQNEEQDFTLVGEPVNLFTGEYYFEKTDLEIPSRGFPFRFIRTYKSGRVFYSPLGFNFDHNYNIYLRKLDRGGAGINTGRLQEDIYSLDEEGNFIPPAGVFARLEEQGGGFGVPEGYLLSYSGGEQHLFEQPSSWPYPGKIPLVKITDANGNNQELVYNSEGLLDHVVDTEGRKVIFMYNSCKLLAAVQTDFSDQEIRFGYDPYIDHLTQAILPASESFPEGIVTCYEYDNYQNHPALTHNIIRVTNALGEVQVENTYGADPGAYSFNRVIRQYFNGAEYRFAYTQLKFVPPMAEYINDGYYQTTYCAPCKPDKIYTFNYRGNLLDERYRLSADDTYRLWAMTYQYNKHGLNTEIRKPSGLGLTYIYDEDNEDVRARGNLLKMILRAPSITMQPAREIMTLTYEDRFQKIKSIADEEGHITEMVYDYEENPTGPAAGNMVRMVHPACTLPDGTVQEAEETFEYNAYGQLEGFTSAEGRSVRYEYIESGDGAGLLRKVTYEDADAPYSMEYNYDARGNTISTTDGNGNETRFEYDIYGNLIKTILPEIDGSAAVYEYSYDALHRLILERSPKGTYSDDQLSDDFLSHTFAYDRAGNVIEQLWYANTASPQKIDLKRDTSGHITKISGPSGQESTFRFDERGLLLEKVLFNETSEPRVTTYTYDLNGNLAAITFPDGRTDTRYFDALGRLSRVELTSPGSAGLPGGAVPAGSTLVSYGFEGAKLVRRQLLNGQSAQYGYNPANKLENLLLTDSGGQPLWDERYLYDADYRKRLAIETVSPVPGGHKLYEYDERARLTGHYRLDSLPSLPPLDTQEEVDAFIGSIDTSVASGSEKYVLQNSAGREYWEVDEGGNTTVFSPVTNNLHQITELTETHNATPVTTAYIYDHNGNRIEDANFIYQYDCVNQPVAVTRKSDGQTVLQLTYNGFGQLAETKDEQGKHTRYIYDGVRLIQTEDGSTGAVEAQFTGGMAREETVLHSKAGGNYFYLQDDLFSLKAVSDETGKLLHTYSYTVFGEPGVLDSNGNAIPLEDAPVAPHFGGRPYLHSLGLYDNKARWYDPKLGSFLQRDPLGYIDSASLYEYARHNPVSYNDPTGAYIESAWDALSLGVGLVSFGYNWSQGNYGYMALDAVGIIADTAALALPIPGGAGIAIRAAIASKKLGRAVDVAEIGATSLKTKSALRALQAADQGLNALVGANAAYESYKEESYGWAAFNVAASALGVRGFFGKAAEAIRPGKATEVFSRQGNLFHILDPDLSGAGRIWGVTMGRVYATLTEKQSVFHTSRTFKNAADDVMFKFSGQAAELFSTIPVKGPFTGLKAITGQQVTNLGDIVLKHSIAMGQAIGDKILVKWHRNGRPFIEVTEATLEKSVVPDALFRQWKYGYVTPQTQHRFMTVLDAGLSLSFGGSAIIADYLATQTPLGAMLSRTVYDIQDWAEGLGKTSEGGC